MVAPKYAADVFGLSRVSASSRNAPAEATFWRHLGQALIEDGKPVEAGPPLERAVALRPKGAAERFWLARAYLFADRPLDAQAQIGELRSLDAAAAAGLSATWPPERSPDLVQRGVR